MAPKHQAPTNKRSQQPHRSTAVNTIRDPNPSSPAFPRFNTRRIAIEMNGSEANRNSDITSLLSGENRQYHVFFDRDLILFFIYRYRQLLPHGFTVCLGGFTAEMKCISHAMIHSCIEYQSSLDCLVLFFLDHLGIPLIRDRIFTEV